MGNDAVADQRLHPQPFQNTQESSVLKQRREGENRWGGEVKVDEGERLQRRCHAEHKCQKVLGKVEETPFISVGSASLEPIEQAGKGDTPKSRLSTPKSRTARGLARDWPSAIQDKNQHFLAFMPIRLGPSCHSRRYSSGIQGRGEGCRRDL